MQQDVSNFDLCAQILIIQHHIFDRISYIMIRIESMLIVFKLLCQTPLLSAFISVCAVKEINWVDKQNILHFLDHCGI